MKAQSDLNEHFPNEVFGEVLSVLALDITTQIMVLAVLHDDIDLDIIDELI